MVKRVSSQNYLPRYIDSKLPELLAAFPAVLLQGPRACGKTTTVKRFAKSIVRLDREAEAAAFRFDPDAALRKRQEPLLIDEWQEVPEILRAIKRSVDDDYRPGRFILTGSVRSELEGKMWPGTGRIVRLNMFSMTERELCGQANQGHFFFDKLATGDLEAFTAATDQPDLRGYLQAALRSGFPTAALHTPETQIQQWLKNYLEQLLERDLIGYSNGVSLNKFDKYFRALSANSAGSPADSTIFNAAGITRETASSYDKTLEALFLAESVEHWSNNTLKQLTRQPKRYVLEAAFLAAQLNLDIDGVFANGDLIGRLIDTFVMAQLRPEVSAAANGTKLFHLRTGGGRREIDVVAQRSDGSILALEIKASATPTLSDARHLIWLRDQLGERFVGGAVLHTGPGIFPLEEQILALPISTLWGG